MQQIKCHPILLALLDALSLPHKILEYPSAAKKVIQEEIKNGFAPLVSWIVSLIATLTLAEVAFSPSYCDRSITSLQNTLMCHMSDTRIIIQRL